MSKKYSSRRSIFRKDAGRAFLRFLIGEVLLVVLCSVFYLFVLQGNVNIKLDLNLFGAKPTEAVEPAATASPVPGTDVLDDSAVITDDAEATQAVTDEATPVPEATDSATAVPTIEPTSEPTPEPTPEPTATPIPAEELCSELEEVREDLPSQLSDQLKLGLRELRVFNDAEQSAVIVRGYAYLEGADAAKSNVYILIADAWSDSLKIVGMLPVQPDPENADLSFDAAEGSNLDNAFFSVNIDASMLEDGTYLLYGAVENGGKIMWSSFDSSMFHFRVICDGMASLE